MVFLFKKLSNIVEYIHKTKLFAFLKDVFSACVELVIFQFHIQSTRNKHLNTKTLYQHMSV